MNIYEALEIMRTMSKDNIPFSMEFLTCDLTRNSSNGLKTVSNCVLRTGLQRDRGIKSLSLVAYQDLDQQEPRFFYLPLLMKFNNIDIE